MRKRKPGGRVTSSKPRKPAPPARAAKPARSAKRAGPAAARTESARIGEPPTRTPADSTPLVLRLVLTALLLLIAVAGLVDGPHLWGISHLAYLPLAARILIPLIALGMIWTPLSQWFGRLLVSRLEPRLLRPRWVAYGVLPLLGLAAFWILRCPAHFLGDGWLLGELVARGAPFHGFDFVDYHLHARLFAVLGLSSETEAFRLFAVVSTISGAFYLAAAAWVARRLSAEPGERITLYALLLCFAPVQMFMGYVECYSILAVFMLLFVAAVAAHYRGYVSAVVPALAFGGGLAFHLDALFLAPLLVLLVLWPPAGDDRTPARRLVEVVIPILALLALAGLFLLLEGYNRTLFELDFFTMRQGQSLLHQLTGEHGLLGWRHWRDFLNLLLLLAPVPLALLAAGLARLRRWRELPRGAVVLLLGAAWLTLLLPLLHMKLGTARDWDLFAAQAAVYVLAAYLLWSRISGGVFSSRFVGMVVATAAVATLPWFWINAGEERSLTRFRDAIGDQPDFARAYAHEEIGKYFRKQAEAEVDEVRKRELIDRALAEYRDCVGIFPSNPRFHGVLGALQFNSGDHAAAFESFQRVYGVDSTYALGLEMLALLHAEREEWEASLFYSRKLAGDSREKSRSASIHGLAAERLGLNREAIDAYTRAIAKDSRRVDLLERIGALAMREEDYDLAERVFRGVLRNHPSDSARVGLLASIWSALRGDPARQRTPEGSQRLQEALGLAEELMQKGSGSENVRRWGEEIRAALSGH